MKLYRIILVDDEEEVRKALSARSNGRKMDF